MSIHKLIPYVPDIKRDDIQILLHKMQEYLEKESGSTREILSKKGEYFNTQHYNARLFVFVDFRFIFALPGTGKSCLQIASVLEVLKQSSIYDRAIIATTTSLVETMVNQTLCKCTDGSFLSRKDGNELLPNEKFKKIFSIISHGELIKKTNKKVQASDRFIGKTVKELNETFKGVILMIDELSELLRVKFTSKKGDDMDTTYSIISDITNLSRYTSIEQLDDPIIKDSDIEYIQIWRITHCVSNLKFMGLTGTPIPNHGPEFFILANLFLPFHLQYDLIWIGNNILNITLNDFRRLNGIISYIGDSAAMAIQNFKGTVVDYTHVFSKDVQQKSKLKLKTTEMFGVQAEKILETNGLSEVVLAKSPIFSYVAMNGTTGESADLGGRQGEIIINTAFNIPTDLQRIDIQMKTSAIFTEIAIKESNFARERIKGCFYVYNKLTRVSNKSFIRILKIHQFEVLTKDDLKPRDKKKGSYCEDDSIVIDRIMTPEPSGKRRVIFIGEDVDIINPIVREEILRVNSLKENVNGDLIAGIVGSEVFLMGVNIGNEDRMYRIYPEYSETAEEQSRKRVIREDSHIFKKEFLSNYYRTEIFPQVDFTYFCAYTEYFYVNPRLIDIVNPLYLRGNRIYSECVAHIIGFCEKGHIQKQQHRIIGAPYFEFFIDGESPFDNLIKIGFNLVYDLTLLGDPLYDIIYVNCGVINIINASDDSLDLLPSKGLILIDSYRKGIKKMNLPGNYMGPLAICPTETEIKFVDLSKEVISTYFNTYMKLERKSFISRKIIRFVKQIASDCLANFQRNILPPIFDNTASCDYDICKYVCSSEIFPIPEQNKDKNIDSEELFWDNKEILYSTDLINECKYKILGLLNENKEVKLDYLYKYLSKYREYFISTAIYEMIRDKANLLDNFGFQCFISSNNEKLFLRRDVSFGYTEIKHSENLNSLIGTLSRPIIERLNLDDNTIKEIEMMPVMNDGQGKILLKTLIDKFRRKFTSKSKLIEDSLIRILTGNEYYCDHIIQDNFRKYIYNNLVNGVKIFIHIHPMEENKKTKQSDKIGISKIKEARYLDPSTMIWRDADKKLIDDFSKIIKNENFDFHTQESLIRSRITGEFVNSPYHILKEDKGNKEIIKFINLNQSKFLGGTEIGSAKKEKLAEAIQFFLDNVDFNQYDPSVYHDCINFLTNYQNMSKTQLGEPFVEICKKLNLFLTMDDVLEEN